MSNCSSATRFCVGDVLILVPKDPVRSGFETKRVMIIFVNGAGRHPMPGIGSDFAFSEPGYRGRYLCTDDPTTNFDVTRIEDQALTGSERIQRLFLTADYSWLDTADQRDHEFERDKIRAVVGQSVWDSWEDPSGDWMSTEDMWNRLTEHVEMLTATVRAAP